MARKYLSSLPANVYLHSVRGNGEERFRAAGMVGKKTLRGPLRSSVEQAVDDAKRLGFWKSPWVSPHQQRSRALAATVLDVFNFLQAGNVDGAMQIIKANAYLLVDET